jgi:molybdopterin converting factor subunit 1
MLVTIRLFARLREIAGTSELERSLPDGATARTAWDALVGEFPPMGDYAAAVSCAVNEEYARLTAVLADGDEVAFLPPVSGGAAPGAAGPGTPQGSTAASVTIDRRSGSVRRQPDR